MEAHENCESCRFWQERGFADRGQCRRYPPVNTWPMSRGSDWCGEYEPNETTAAALHQRMLDLIRKRKQDDHTKNTEE